MSDVEYATDVSQIDSIVLGAVENAASNEGLSLSPAAKDYLTN
ncbi:MAG TPA: hypothetical protein VK722_03925 [Candidatus Aquilonibacter sp.]|jgi:hypothetical protein|nr:hypothetical protein [Candidatus Aquilonibacter sp.]